jgi:DNA polymerase (family 10)
VPAHHGLDRKTGAAALKEIADLLEVHRANPHRVRAFANAARTVERIEGDLAEMVSSGAVLQIKGIGKGTAAVLADLASGRQPQALAELHETTPPGVRQLLKIAGLGPKKVGSLWRELGITGAGELEYACRENRLVDLPGFGPASQAKLLESVRFHLLARDRHLVHQAWSHAASLVADLETDPAVERAMVAGELRRGCETVGRIDLVVVGGADAADRLVELLERAERLSEHHWRGVTGGGHLVDARLAPPERAAVELVRATGTEAHLEALSRQAEAMGLRFDDRGLRSGEEALDVADEQQLYDAIGCQWVPPELREDGREVAAAASRKLPELVAGGDLLGALHNHTTGSDGTASAGEMASAAAALGWKFLGIADHSPAAHYANGLTPERLQSQWQEIDRLNAAGEGARLIKGLEADILPDGQLDIPEGCEAGLEYVVASVHSSFRLDEASQTERIIAAVRHPACRVLGHPTGRLLLARPGYPVDLEAVLAACAEEAVAVEINASPYRLDLDHVWARRAVEIGVTVVINPDAHSPDGLEDVRWGLSVARRAGATAADVLNCRPIDAWLARE